MMKISFLNETLVTDATDYVIKKFGADFALNAPWSFSCMLHEFMGAWTELQQGLDGGKLRWWQREWKK